MFNRYKVSQREENTVMSARHHNDVDDIMASIMGGKTTPVKKSPKRPVFKPAQEVNSSHKQSVAHSNSEPRRRRHRSLIVFVAIFIAVTAIVGLAWKFLLSDVLQPKSPFSEEMTSKMEVPLYYPTKLPGTFKMELGSIVQPEDKAVVYAITDEVGKKVNVSLQRQPQDINLDPFYAVLSDIKEVDTKFGKVKVGKSEENIDIANVLTGQTWIIINSASGTLDDAALATIIDGLRF